MYGLCSWDVGINQTKIKGGCQSGRKVVPHDSKSNLLLAETKFVSKKKLWDIGL